MRYRALGKTGLTVSEIGFGTWGIGGDSYGPVDDSESKETLRLAFEKGITFYDTANVYGAGRSERILGEALRDVRKEIVIATKVGSLSYSGRHMEQEFTVRRIYEGIEGSLKRLKTDYVDVYQLHSPPADVLDDDHIIKALEDLKKHGKIRALGVSVRSPEDGMVAAGKNCFETIQVNFNLIDHRFIESGLHGAALKENIGIISRTPLCFGFLTGTMSDEAGFKSGDHRSGWSKSQIKTWAESVKLFESLYTRRGWTPAKAALKFCLSYPGVSTVIPGMMNKTEVEENAVASELDTLEEDELAMIKRIYESHVFFNAATK
ncbi:MAG: aldo/keto reductase [Deltaproteobacteria bacterium]|nr:aldo/keto reductase [Deltaproteobacteria bacterium]